MALVWNPPTARRPAHKTDSDTLVVMAVKHANKHNKSPHYLRNVCVNSQCISDDVSRTLWCLITALWSDLYGMIGHRGKLSWTVLSSEILLGSHPVLRGTVQCYFSSVLFCSRCVSVFTLIWSLSQILNHQTVIRPHFISCLIYTTALFFQLIQKPFPPPSDPWSSFSHR